MEQPLNMQTIASLREIEDPGDTSFITEVITTYLADTEIRFHELRTALAKGSADSMAKSAHAIKGSSLNVGADGLAEFMATVEREGKRGILASADSLAVAETLFRRIHVALKAYLDEAGGTAG